MNYKEYLELFTEDFNLIFVGAKPGLTKSKRVAEHLLRMQVMTFHLHVDFLLGEIIKNKFLSKLESTENKKIYDNKNLEFMEKLRLVYSTGFFDEDLFNTFRILNNVRNHLSHNLMVELYKEEKRIKSLKIPEVITKEEARSLTAIEHLFYSSIGCINNLAEYLHRDIFSERLSSSLNIAMPPAGSGGIPAVSVVSRR